MKKIKVPALIFIGALIHFLLMAKFIVDRLTCDVQPNCVTLVNKIAVIILGFTLDFFAWLIQRFGFDVNIVAYIGGIIFIVYFINSILAVCLIWMLLVRPLFRKNPEAKSL